MIKKKSLKCISPLVDEVDKIRLAYVKKLQIQETDYFKSLAPSIQSKIISQIQFDTKIELVKLNQNYWSDSILKKPFIFGGRQYKFIAKSTHLYEKDSLKNNFEIERISKIYKNTPHLVTYFKDYNNTNNKDVSQFSLSFTSKPSFNIFLNKNETNLSNQFSKPLVISYEDKKTKLFNIKQEIYSFTYNNSNDEEFKLRLLQQNPLISQYYIPTILTSESIENNTFSHIPTFSKYISSRSLKNYFLISGLNYQSALPINLSDNNHKILMLDDNKILAENLYQLMNDGLWKNYNIAELSYNTYELLSKIVEIADLTDLDTLAIIKLLYLSLNNYSNDEFDNFIKNNENVNFYNVKNNFIDFMSNQQLSDKLWHEFI